MFKLDHKKVHVHPLMNGHKEMILDLAPPQRDSIRHLFWGEEQLLTYLLPW